MTSLFDLLDLPAFDSTPDRFAEDFPHIIEESALAPVAIRQGKKIAGYFISKTDFERLQEAPDARALAVSTQSLPPRAARALAEKLRETVEDLRRAAVDAPETR